MDISAYKQENEVLLRKIEEEKLRSRTSPISMIESSMENLRISNPSSNILGRSRISGESALLLLEVIALRRNLNRRSDAVHGILGLSKYTLDGHKKKRVLC